MKLIQKLLFLFVILLPLVGCKDESNSVEPESFNTDKTIIVYMAADNNLSPYATDNINSIKSGFSKNTVNGNLVIYVDQGQSPQLILLQKNQAGIVTEKVMKVYPSQNSVSPSVMSSVIADVVSAFPSKSYGLVLWSHGYGWIPSGKATRAPATRWFGADGSNFMDIPDLVSALSKGPHFQYILFDACFMGGVEAAYALRNCTDYLLTSPAEVMGDGFPYEEIFSPLFGNNESDYIKIASTYYDHYNQLSGANRSASIGCIKCSELDALASQTAKLIAAHASQVNTVNITTIQPFECYNPHLFYDFGNFIASFSTSQELADFNAQMQKVVVYKACTPNITSVRSSSHYEQVPIVNYSGLNCYIPQAATQGYNVAYRTSDWFIAAGYDKVSW